jgi:hypothetical protein
VTSKSKWVLAGLLATAAALGFFAHRVGAAHPSEIAGGKLVPIIEFMALLIGASVTFAFFEATIGSRRHPLFVVGNALTNLALANLFVAWSRAVPFGEVLGFLSFAAGIGLVAVSS